MNIRDVFDSEKIEYFAPLPLCDLKVIKPYLIERLCISCECGSALVLCVYKQVKDYQTRTAPAY